VTLPAGTDPSKVAIAPDGTVRADGRRVGQIALVTVPAPSQLLAAGDGQFAPTAASGPIRKAKDSTVQQAKLEASTASIDELLPATHAFQFLSKVVQTEDQMPQIANQPIR
jgi:flagellar basal body rod protein FlgG